MVKEMETTIGSSGWGSEGTEKKMETAKIIGDNIGSYYKDPFLHSW